jgi:hypothetical protein
MRQDHRAAVPNRSPAASKGGAALVCVHGLRWRQRFGPPELPIPLVERLPLVMGMHLSEELLDSSHQEKLQTGGDWTIDLGPAQPSCSATCSPACSTASGR